MNRYKNNKKNGMTLVEILIVISLIGILTGFLVKSLSSSTESAKIASAKLFCQHTAKAAIESYRLRHNNSLPMTWDQMTDDFPSQPLDPWNVPYELFPVPKDRPQFILVYSTLGKSDAFIPGWGTNFASVYAKMEEENARLVNCVGAVIR